MNLNDNRVGLIEADAKGYFHIFPFDPPENYPEYKGNNIQEGNHVYKSLRNLLSVLNLDKENFGSENWNPFGDFIEPGMHVFIKTNTVRHENLSGQDILSVINHASVIRPVLDYTITALKGRGRITLGDSQVTAGDFDKAMEISQIGPLLDWYREQTDIPIELLDLRINRSRRTWLYGKWGREKIEKDPMGYRFVDLKNLSYFKDIDPAKLRIGIASYKVMYKHHSDGHHEYLFPGTLLDSDVIINIPKMKTHRRTGITLAIKNFMGLPALKDSLPHFTVGSPEEGGDQYINRSFRKKIGTRMHDIIQTNPHVPVKFFFAIIKKLNWKSRRIIPFKDDIFEAMWPGNDTVWRTLLDLNRAAFYADKEGILHHEIQRKYFCILDGLIGGEKDGPVAPDPVDSRTILGGFNPVAVDCAASTLMGFDIDKIRLLTRGLDDAQHKLPIFLGKRDDIRIQTTEKTYNLMDFSHRYNLHFEAHPNWKGQIERERIHVSAAKEA